MQEGAAEEGQGGCIIFLSAMSGVVYLRLGLDSLFLLHLVCESSPLYLPSDQRYFFSTSPALPSGESAVCYR